MATVVAAILAATPAVAGVDTPPAAPTDTVPDRLAQNLSRRLFPVLNGAARPDSLATLAARLEVRRVLADRAGRRQACGTETLCQARAMLWQAAEIEVMTSALASLPGVPAPEDGVANGVGRELRGLDTIIETYALGGVPAYPAIDGSGIPADGPEAQTRTKAALALAQTPRAGSLQALDPSIEFALALLDTNDRTDAIGFEPISAGLNEPAFARARTLEWARYRYSAMVVTGVGPEVPEMPLSPLGKLHLRLAANRFARGDIPYIIVTGGRANPRATRFTEAEEMRSALIHRYGVPAEAIVIEPYARHTTTNLRNAARLLMMLGAPLAKDLLIVCNPVQSATIEGPAFAARNLRELGYLPGRVGKRVSPTELEYRPSSGSARIDPHDPLDP
ncbi:YdcF family protein [Sphingomonas deserti]|uniref:YdcF family protein n=1 Tax=Allosphingosinicella deserti TaxID=2116704 RepID=A0A2P7R035_9SPHN|nr:YdcF family protein [Sphingomonas deserti]